MALARLFLLLSCLAFLGQALTPSSFLSTVDRQRLQKAFSATLTSSSSSDLSSLHFAVLGYQLLGEKEPLPSGVQLQSVCQRLQDKLKAGAGATVTTAYQAATAAKALKCPAVKADNEVQQLLKKALSSAEVSVSDLHNGVLAQQALGLKADKAVVLKSLQAALKKDDSLTNLGLAFNLAAQLEGASAADVKAVFDRVEDAVVQADEVDGKMLQFEGGLSVTNLLLTGAYRLAGKVNKAPAVSKQQSVKFANYFLSRKSVQTAKGGFHLLEALTTLAGNKFHVPVAVTLADGPSAVVDADHPKVRVRITDLLGKSLGKMAVEVESAMRQSDGAVVMSKTKMAAVAGDDSLYDVDMMSAKPGKGFYELTLSAAPPKADDKLVGNVGAMLLIKVLGGVAVTSAEIGVVDADQSTAPKLAGVSHPGKLAKALSADHHHKLVFKFALTDKANQEKIRVHQAFVRLTHAESKAEIVFVAEPDSNNVYKFDLDVSAKSKDFGQRSGKYALSLIVGDAVISNPFEWHVADVDFTFPEASAAKSASAAEKQTVQPEIRHLFRQPEVRPPATVSNVFTVLCLLPFLIMLVCWAKLGVNVAGFRASQFSALGFQFGLCSIFGLYVYFWLQLNMFETIKYLFMAGIVTFLCGNKMLVNIAEKRKQH